MEQESSRAPLTFQYRGWSVLRRVFHSNSGCSTSRSHATHTQRADYLGVPEEATRLLVAVECHKPSCASLWYVDSSTPIRWVSVPSRCKYLRVRDIHYLTLLLYS